MMSPVCCIYLTSDSPIKPTSLVPELCGSLQGKLMRGWGHGRGLRAGFPRKSWGARWLAPGYFTTWVSWSKGKELLGLSSAWGRRGLGADPGPHMARGGPGRGLLWGFTPLTC